jgi:hypothetical protein
VQDFVSSTGTISLAVVKTLKLGFHFSSMESS